MPHTTFGGRELRGVVEGIEEESGPEQNSAISAVPEEPICTNVSSWL